MLASVTLRPVSWLFVNSPQIACGEVPTRRYAIGLVPPNHVMPTATTKSATERTDAHVACQI